jgi:hypothetical protein
VPDYMDPPKEPVNGAVWSASGHGWVCVGCAYFQMGPLEISERPAMLIVHGMSWCAIHGSTAMRVVTDFTTESPAKAVARIMGLHGRDKRCWE